MRVMLVADDGGSLERCVLEGRSEGKERKKNRKEKKGKEV